MARKAGVCSPLGMKVLVAEDDNVSRLLLASTLKNAGHDVVTVTHGEDAWRVLNEPDAPRFALLDWGLDGLDGVEICRRVRARGAPYVYVILVTTRTNKEDLVEAFRSGADDFIGKPFDKDELSARIRAGERILNLEESLQDAQLALLSDISERKATEALLNAEKQVLELLAQNAPLPDVLDCICCRAEELVDGALCMVRVVSPDGADLTAAAAPTLPAPFLAACSRIPIAPHATSCGAAAHLGERYDAIDISIDDRWTQWRDAAAAAGLVACSSTPVVGASGRVIATVAFFFRKVGSLEPKYLRSLDRAVTLVRIAIERQQVESKLLLAERMASVGTLAAGVAHEINNPLAYIFGNIAYVNGAIGRAEPVTGGARILDQATAEEMVQALDEALDGAQRVRNIVSDLRTASRADDQGLGPVDLRQVLDVAIRITNNLMRHSARLVVDLDEVPTVQANESRLGQVFVNLLANAAQAMPERDTSLNEIRVRSRSEGGNAVVEVTDNGSGMSRETIRRIFDPFFTTKAVGVGTGLGLSICHSIVTAVGGTITVDSVVGVGTTFRVSIPVPAVEAKPAERRTTTSVPPPNSRARVLVIDDEPFVGAMVRRMLGGDHDVVAVGSGKEAIDLLVAGQYFDVVLCDLMMSGMTGMDVFTTLKREAPHVADRVGFITGGAFTPRSREFLESGAHKLLQKPFDARSLRTFVRTIADT